MILYILALKETLRMKNKEHCPTTTTLPVRERNVAEKLQFEIQFDQRYIFN